MPDLGPLGSKIIGKTPEGRPIILNPDGSVSTERTVTVTDPRINGGRPTNIPTIFGGHSVPPAMAADIIASNKGIDPETKKSLPGFDSLELAEKAAIERSKSLGALIDKLMSAQPGGQKKMKTIRPGHF